MERAEERMQIKSRQKSQIGAAARGWIAAALLAVGVAGAGLWITASGAQRTVSVLTAADISAWAPWAFSGKTRYTPVEIDHRRAVKAISDDAASGLYRKISIDLHETPVLHWGWRVDNTLGDINERTKKGDDYPARVYVLAAHPLFFWRTRALSYVWSSVQPGGSDWPNAYAENAWMVAVRSGEQGLGRWHQEQRNVREDFERYFGKDVRYVDAVALMTDTDNTGRKATAYYGPIYFADR